MSLLERACQLDVRERHNEALLDVVKQLSDDYQVGLQLRDMR